MLTIEEAAEEADCHPQTIYSWIEKGKFPVERREVIRIDASQFRKWVDAWTTYRRGVGEDSAYPSPENIKKGEFGGWENEILKAVSPLSSNVLADGFAEVEKHRIAVRQVWLGLPNVTDMRRYFADGIIKWDVESYEDGTRRIGTLWGAELLEAPLERSEIYIFGEPEGDKRMSTISVVR